MKHAYYESAKQQQQAAYRAHLKEEIRSFSERRVVEPRSHGRILRSQMGDGS